MVPTCYGYIKKNAEQERKAIPKINFETTLKGGFKTAPNIGFTVATQMTIQNIFQNIFSPNPSDPSLSVTLASSGIAGIICSPLLAGFNGQTRNKPFFESVKCTTLMQTIAIAIRETCFIASMRIDEPLSILAKQKLGNKKWIEYGSTFLSGSLGSIIGHPADTILTLLQTGEQIKASHLFRGIGSRTFATGAYVVIYKKIESHLLHKPN